MYIYFYKPYLRAVDTWNIRRLIATLVVYFVDAPVDLQSQKTQIKWRKEMIQLDRINHLKIISKMEMRISPSSPIPLIRSSLPPSSSL